MADPKKREDFENMSDEDFLKLSEEDFSGNVSGGETLLTNEDEYEENTPAPTPENTDSTEDDHKSAGNDESDDVGGNNSSQSDEEFEAATSESGPDPLAGEGEQAPEGGETPDGEQSTTDPEKEGETGSKTSGSGDGDVKDKDDKAETPAKAGYYKLPEGMDSAGMDTVVGFYQKITAPFKADGKDITVRSPEDAIRLMQQGVNYSRRMQEMKPMKTLHRTLTDQGLDDPSKLNFLIDLSKGDKAAITQLLKSHKIDPMDLDTEKDSGYQARNYQGDPQDHEFRDALDNALITPEGQALVSHIHKDWDRTSKAKLRENPQILGNLNELKVSGVYDKVVEELRYQQSMGYLVNVPFLQAFDQVGEAMKNAGVFAEATQNPGNGAQMAPLNAAPPQKTPIASGGRKQPGSKKPAANPHLSSTPPAKQSGNTAPAEPDFAKMSDEEFLKMPPPE